MSDLPSRERLYWQCRRGMLELDYLLQNFLENSFDLLEAEEKQRFVQLLSESDQDLFAWLLNPEGSVPDCYASLVEAIRSYCV